MTGNIVILKWNPAISSFSMLDFLEDIRNQDGISNWSIYEHDKVSCNDRFFMLKVGCGTNGIVEYGKIMSDPYRDEDWMADRGKPTYYCDLKIQLRLNPETFPILASETLEDIIPDFDWRGGHSGIVLPAPKATVFKKIWNSYLRENANLIIRRRNWIARHNMQNDQIFADEAMLSKLEEIAGGDTL